ncbi:MAG: universal stress protein [Janthinobacterium lividum]
MSYRTILVHADLSRHAPQRFRIAAQLAHTHGAHLIAVAATGVSREVFPHGYHAIPGSLEASFFDPLRDSATRALEHFNTIAQEVNVSHESRLVWDLASDALARMARFSDLVIVNQDDLSEALAETIGRIPEYVAFTSARPVLVLPCAPVIEEPGQRILIAWNGSKESSAAIQAAVPLLRCAKQVSVVSFRTPADRDLSDSSYQADLASFLARHEIRAEILAFDRHIDRGNALLTMARQDAYDLIVIGCYGHSQFRELFLGGVTRTVLQDTTIPVLMSR